MTSARENMGRHGETNRPGDGSTRGDCWALETARTGVTPIPTGLSGGRQQRIAIARALAPNPDVLLLDEPTSALDARLRERLRREVGRIQSELGVTTLYVTHDWAEALAVSDRGAVLSDGRVEQVGTPREVYREPSTRFVAEFVAENNVFDGSTSPVETKGSRGEAVEEDARIGRGVGEARSGEVERAWRNGEDEGGSNGGGGRRRHVRAPAG